VSHDDMSEPGSTTPPPGRKSRLVSLAEFLKSVAGVITGTAALLAAVGTLVGYFVTRDENGSAESEAPPVATQAAKTSISAATTTPETTTTTAPRQPADAVDIQLDQRVEGEISRVGEVDRYRLTLAAPTRVFPDSLPVDGECGSGATINWSLAPEEADAPVFDGLLYSGYCYDERLRSLQAETYVLSVKGSGTATSRYAFTLRSAPEDIRELKIGERAEGSLDAPGQTDRWRVTVNRPTTVLFDAIPNVGDKCGPGESLSWKLSLEGSETPIANDLFYGGGFCYDRENVSFPRAATYDLVISGQGDEVGPYIFRLVPSG
jgi:hypothetical protein